MKTFYNTTSERGQMLMNFEEKSELQDQKVLNFFKTNIHCGFTPETVHESIFDKNTPLTSIRRAINTLKKQGKLIKFEHIKSTGSYGRPVFVWCYNEKYNEL